jgi:hypothetical protein
MIMYVCNLCKNSIEKLISRPQDVKGVVPCHCGGWLERQMTAPSSNSVETIDSGANVKPIVFDRNRYDLAKEQGDTILKEKQEKE